jgi:hypothetical protein
VERSGDLCNGAVDLNGKVGTFPFELVLDVDAWWDNSLILSVKF